jgi:hypothetical protein
MFIFVSGETFILLLPVWTVIAYFCVFFLDGNCWAIAIWHSELPQNQDISATGRVRASLGYQRPTKNDWNSKDCAATTPGSD